MAESTPANVPVFTLNNGLKISGVGLGCWLGAEGGGAAAEEMTRNALKLGYRHIDTASGYSNEEHVGKAIRESGIPRSEIFLTTKLHPREFTRVRETFESSLAKLGCEYIDLYLMHAPMAVVDGRTLAEDEHPTFVDVWAEMEQLLGTGRVRAIGVSNFSVKTLSALLPHARVVPANNQVELHPCLPQHDLKAFCDAKGILLTAYSPLGQGNPLYFTDPDFVRMAEAHGATPAQIALSWLVQRGTPPIVKSANVERLKQNLTLVTLSPEEMETIDNFHTKPGMHRSLVTSMHSPEGTVVGWTYEQLGWNMTVGGFVTDTQ